MDMYACSPHRSHSRPHALVLVWVLWHLGSSTSATCSRALGSSDGTAPAVITPATSESAPTAVYAHNLMLRKGPDFRIYVRWLRGNMVRTSRDVNPTFDDPESFYMDIKTGVVRANIGDIGNFLNAGGVANSPLRNIMLLADGDQIRLKGTLHKVISLPVELLGSVTATSDNRIQLHITKLNVLKIPFKGLLGGLNIKLSDLIQPKGIPGIEVSGNEIFFDTLKLLPPPHIRGQLTKVRVVSPDIEEVLRKRRGRGDPRRTMEKLSAAERRHHRLRKTHHASRGSHHGGPVG